MGRALRLPTILMLIVLLRSVNTQSTYQLVGQAARVLSPHGTITFIGALGTPGAPNVISSYIAASSPTESIRMLPESFDFHGVTATSTELSYDGVSLMQDVFLGADTRMSSNGERYTNESSLA